MNIKSFAYMKHVISEQWTSDAVLLTFKAIFNFLFFPRFLVVPALIVAHLCSLVGYWRTQNEGDQRWRILHFICSGIPWQSYRRETFFLRHTCLYRVHCWRCIVCDQAGLIMISVQPLLWFLTISPLIPGPVDSTQSPFTTLHTPIIICWLFFLLFHLPSAFVLSSLHSFPLFHRCVFAHLWRETASGNAFSREAVVFGTLSLHDIIPLDVFAQLLWGLIKDYIKLKEQSEPAWW